MAKLALDHVIESVATSPLFLGAKTSCARTAAKVVGRELSNRKAATDLLATQLFASVDRRELKQLGNRRVCPTLEVGVGGR